MCRSENKESELAEHVGSFQDFVNTQFSRNGENMSTSEIVEGYLNKYSPTKFRFAIEIQPD